MTDLISRADAIEAIASRDETDGTVKVFTGRQVNEILSALPSADAVSREAIMSAKFHPLPYTHITPTDADAESYKRGWNDALDAVADNAPSAEAVTHGRLIDADALSEKLCETTIFIKDGEVFQRMINDAPTVSAEAVQGWIPCSERLPETHTEYVIENPWMQVSITKDTYQLSNPVLGYGKRKYYSDGDPMMAVVWYEDDGYGRTGWITAPDCEDIDVIAWMPLPKPYREDGEV